MLTPAAASSSAKLNRAVSGIFTGTGSLLNGDEAALASYLANGYV